MRKIQITSRMRSCNEDMEELFARSYDQDGVLHEQRILSREVDYNRGLSSRTSRDKGKTWSEWETHYEDQEDSRHGAVANSPEGDELVGTCVPTLFDPKTGCTVGVGGKHYYLKGHSVGYFDWWEKGEDNWRPHAYYAMRRPDGTEVTRLLELEEGGADFDPANPRNPAFIDKNRGYASDPKRLSDGRIVFFHLPSMRICCNLAGVDVNTFFPSCPDMQQGLLLGHLHWNEETKDYDVTYSNPIMLSDLQSSRGIMEPQIEELQDGRLLLVVRGSNDQIDVWNTRISASAPGFKWYTISEDGGKTFPPLMPWYFDTREVLYSSASMSRFFRSSKNGKLYWIGTVVTEPWKVKGNNPRWPLHICQVDDKEGCLLKETLTVVDTVREGQDSVELSNFTLLEDPDTKVLELRMTKINFNDNYQDNGGPGAWYSEAWEYEITFEE